MKLPIHSETISHLKIKEQFRLFAVLQLSSIVTEVSGKILVPTFQFIQRQLLKDQRIIELFAVLQLSSNVT